MNVPRFQQSENREGSCFDVHTQVGFVTFSNVQLIAVSFSQGAKLDSLNNLADKSNRNRLTKDLTIICSKASSEMVKQ